MKLKNQVCSFEQAKKLKEFGIVQDSLFYHFPNPNIEETKKKYKLPDYNIVEGSKLLHKQIKDVRELVLDGTFQKTYSAFTVAELFAMLGNEYMPALEFGYAKTQSEALAILLISYIENNFIKPKQANKRLLTS